MEKSFKKLMRKQVQDAMNQYAILLKKPVPRQGWLRAVRQALGMTSSHVAKKLGTSPANILKIEKSEAAGTINLKTLNKVAESMNCKLVYGLVPLKPLEEMLEDRALFIAKKRTRATQHTMLLENQGLSHDQLQYQEEALAKQLLEGDLRKLWDEPDEL